jgi:putative aminopeptidase FrvX
VSGCRRTLVRAYIEHRARPFADKMLTDANGQPAVFRKGRKPGQPARHGLAHMDEVGIIVLGASRTAL